MLSITRRGYDFDDVMLEPRESFVDSRDEVSLASRSVYFTTNLPIIASPMKGITSPELITAMANKGGIGLMHRFYRDNGEFINDMDRVARNVKNIWWGISVGLASNKLFDENERITMAIDVGASYVCIDVANGYLQSVLRTTERVANQIARRNGILEIIVGNVVTTEGIRNLVNSGATMIRVGIGSGNLCTTRKVTGVGMPQLTAINDCAVATAGTDIALIADGGIRTSGDAVKALAAGADYVMIGSLLAKTDLSANNGIIYGMASRRLQEEYYSATKKSIEGIEQLVEKDTTFEDFMNEFTWGMRSAFTYMNAKNIKELQKNANFVEVKG